jgi:hypothetical protein
MRRIGIALLATVGIVLATPALAQGLYFGAGPGGIGIGVSPGYNGGYYNGGYYNDGYAPAYGYQRPGYGNYEGSYAYSPRYQRCRTVMIQTRDGNLRRARRCY